MDDEPKNPLIKENAPNIGAHPPVTERPIPRMIETPEKSQRKQLSFIRTLKIGIPLAGIVAIALLLLFLIIL